MEKKVLSGRVLIESLKKLEGDVPWSEQFGYIYLCFREITKMLVLGSRYSPPV